REVRRKAEDDPRGDADLFARAAGFAGMLPPRRERIRGQTAGSATLHASDPERGRILGRDQRAATGVAQTSKSAVSRVSKPAELATSHAQPIWKSAIQQVWKPALR